MRICLYVPVRVCMSVREKEREVEEKAHVKSLPEDKKVYTYIKMFKCPLRIELMDAFMQACQGGKVPGRKDPILRWILCRFGNLYGLVNWIKKIPAKQR